MKRNTWLKCCCHFSFTYFMHNQMKAATCFSKFSAMDCHKIQGSWKTLPVKFGTLKLIDIKNTSQLFRVWVLSNGDINYFHYAVQRTHQQCKCWDSKVNKNLVGLFCSRWCISASKCRLGTKCSSNNFFKGNYYPCN